MHGPAIVARPELEMQDFCGSLADASPMPMACVEGASHIARYANPAFCLLARKPKEEIIGNPFSQALPADHACLSLLERVRRTGHGETHTGTESSTSPGSQWSYVFWPVIAENKSPSELTLVLVIETSASQRSASAMNQALMVGSVHQHELREAADALNAQLETEIIERKRVESELRRANEDLNQFAFAASHDLQEPLRNITIFSQLLIKGYRGKLDDEAAMYVDVIGRGAEHMRDLLADLLSFTEAGASGPESAESVDLNSVIQKVRANLRALTEESGAVITCGDLPSVKGQSARFEQLFQNVIGNAIKYREERPIRIDISVRELNGEWRFAVTDNGMGISPEYHLEIFGVFKRLHGRAIPGTGIGLAICQRVVERCGGRIWVESQPGEGSTFYFTLPMLLDGAPTTSVSTSQIIGEHGPR
jgi:signal transduction histidine kinase